MKHKEERKKHQREFKKDGECIVHFVKILIEHLLCIQHFFCMLGNINRRGNKNIIALILAHIVP